jgi:2-polyprenyl-6-methoxyphenol hydroxylase-like FAD-dependent oxidoreductase
MSHVEQTPVLIVGGGPVGLALSIDLSCRGIRHILLEQDSREARADHPRMDQIGRVAQTEVQARPLWRRRPTPMTQEWLVSH